MAAVDPLGLIAETERATRRRRQTDLLALAAPPAAAMAVAAALGRLPVELAVAGLIAALFLTLFVTTIEVGELTAAAFLDRSLAAKDHFLTLATTEPGAALRAVVESGARALVAARGVPALPPRRSRPLLGSTLASAALLALLWLVPVLGPLVEHHDPLSRLAATLADSPDPLDRRVASELRIVVSALRDRSLSNADKLEKVKAALDEISKAEQAKRRQGGSGSSGGSGGKGEQAGKEQTGGAEQGRGNSQGGAGQAQSPQGEAGNAVARGAAKQELSKVAGELQQAEQKNDSKSDSKQGEQKKPNPSGGGIQGPESGADERKPGRGESSSNQPGKSPDKPGSGEQPGDAQGEGKSQQGQPPRPGRSEGQGQGPGAGAGEGASNRPSNAPDAKKAERYYKPGEGPGALVDGKYVTIRVPEEPRRLPGTEPVAKPGDVELGVGYGNAPLPSAGSPGEVSVDQPVPLEYRAALGGAAK